MTKQKITVSIQNDLIDALDIAADGFNISRSRLVEKAIGEYLQSLEAKQRLDLINQAYEEDVSDEKELRTRRKMHKSIVEGEW